MVTTTILVSMEEVVKEDGIEDLLVNGEVFTDAKVNVRKWKYVSERASRTAEMVSEN